MQVLGVVGPSDSGKTTLVERLATRLADRGRVATVKHCSHDPDLDTEGKDTARHRAAGADATYGLTDDAGWFATGADRSLEATLDDLAPDYDYAVVEGYTDAYLPQVELGGREGAGTVLQRAERAADVDLEALIATLEATDPHETLEALVARVERSADADRAGAIATFTGRVRAKDSPDDERTEYLEFERYDGLAEERIDALQADLEAREDVFAVALHHRTGIIEAGEHVVFVVVLAGHRESAFRAVENGIDRLKAEVPLFKKEVTVSEEFWRHER
ncbi:molybdopterin synthase [Salinarchaeum sp. Harcht-Bsk1]|uniref:molybdopterin synthase n=1 Tax=Salinarchaeum sp. Harcht-Bsk1 TaxID=1333523 RepID=UPI000677D8BA|nr:molybdopterin synthase [Salinarchaeum sp. Harcht-Bsk1]